MRILLLLFLLCIKKLFASFDFTTTPFLEHEDFCVVFRGVNTAERVGTTTPNEAISVTKGISSNQYSKEQKSQIITSLTHGPITINGKEYVSGLHWLIECFTFSYTQYQKDMDDTDSSMRQTLQLICPILETNILVSSSINPLVAILYALGECARPNQRVSTQGYVDIFVVPKDYIINSGAVFVHLEHALGNITIPSEEGGGIMGETRVTGQKDYTKFEEVTFPFCIPQRYHLDRKLVVAPTQNRQLIFEYAHSMSHMINQDLVNKLPKNGRRIYLSPLLFYLLDHRQSPYLPPRNTQKLREKITRKMNLIRRANDLQGTVVINAKLSLSFTIAISQVLLTVPIDLVLSLDTVTTDSITLISRIMQCNNIKNIYILEENKTTLSIEFWNDIYMQVFHSNLGCEQKCLYFVDYKENWLFLPLERRRKILLCSEIWVQTCILGNRNNSGAEKSDEEKDSEILEVFTEAEDVHLFMHTIEAQLNDDTSSAATEDLFGRTVTSDFSGYDCNSLPNTQVSERIVPKGSFRIQHSDNDIEE